MKLDDEGQALLLLCFLAISYHFRDMMIYGRDSISLEDVKINFQSKMMKIDSDLTSNNARWALVTCGWGGITDKEIR